MSTRKEAIEQALEICNARIEYNSNLSAFYETCEDEEFILFIKSTLERDIRLLTSDKLKAYKKMALLGSEQDKKQFVYYANLLHGIIEKDGSLDELYYSLSGEYSNEKTFMTKTVSHKVSNQKKRNATIAKAKAEGKISEAIYLLECITLLQPYISKTLEIFLDEIEFTVIPGHQDLTYFISKNKKGLFWRESKYQSLLTDMLILCEQNPELKNQYYEKVDNLNTGAMSSMITIREKDKDPKSDKRMIFFEHYNFYLDLVTTKAEMLRMLDVVKGQEKEKLAYNLACEKYDVALEGQATQVVVDLDLDRLAKEVESEENDKLQKASQQQKALELKTALIKQVKQTSLELDVTKKMKEAFLAFKELQKQREINHKLKVSETRDVKEKQGLKDEKLIKENNAKTAADHSSVVLQSKKQKNIQGLQLLHKLNQHNLNLLQRLLAKKMPAGQISFQSIENLIGKEPGKLPGTLTGGSHKKIVLNGKMGFYDDLSLPDTTGPGWKAHGEQHASKLPIMAIKLIRSTLNRAGITSEVLDIFQSALNELKVKNGIQIGFDVLLHTIDRLETQKNKLQNQKNKLIFLMGIHKPSASPLYKTLKAADPKLSPFADEKSNGENMDKKLAKDPKRDLKAKAILKTIFEFGLDAALPAADDNLVFDPTAVGPTATAAAGTKPH